MVGGANFGHLSYCVLVSANHTSTISESAVSKSADEVGKRVSSRVYSPLLWGSLSPID